VTSSGAERRASLEAEMKSRLGLVPSFFWTGQSTDMAERLWAQARNAYLDNEIPSLLKEELFAYLSRFCEAPYCMVRHAAFLQGLGYPAGDRSAAPREPAQVLSLLRRPVASSEELESHLKLLSGHSDTLRAWPEDSGSPLGAALFACAVQVFLKGDLNERCLAELRRCLGPEKLERLLALLGFIRTAHAWTEAHAPLEFEPDLAELLRGEPGLRAWIDEYRSAASSELAEGNVELFHLTAKHQELEQSTARFGAILEESFNEIYLFDAETLRFTQVNRGARENLGYSMRELRGLTPLDLKPDLSVQSFAELIAPLRSGEKSRVNFSAVHRRKDGSRYPVEVHLQLSEGAGSPTFIAIILDLTERNAQQAEIAEIGARAQAILNTAADAIVTINEFGLIEDVNDATLRLFAYDEAELLGQNVRILMPAPYKEAHDGYLEQYRRTREPKIIGEGREVEARRKDGSVFPIRLSVGEATFDRGRLFTGIIHDLSAQSAAESERDESNRRLGALYSQRASLAGLCTLDGILFDTNKASLDYVGVELDAVIGLPFWETPWWSHDPALQAKLRDGLERAAAGEFVRFDATHPRVDGELGVLDFSITPVCKPDGSIDLLLVESIDVTEARSLHQQLLQAQKMEAIGALAGGIAHDFNNLLTSIRGSSEILMEHLEPGGRLARSADRIQRAADRAAALTTRLLGISRRQVIQARPVDLNEAVREIRELFIRTLAEDVEFKMNLSPGPLYAQADASQIGQVLMNLVVNAGDAMEAGGTLTLETSLGTLRGVRSVELGLPEGDYVAVRVCDTGPGIPPEDRAHIFDPFFTTKEPGKGTGLGLSTSLGIIREHGGTIGVESVVGSGTTFTILLPVANLVAQEATAGAAVAPRTRAEGETILLVEDDETMSELLSEVLAAEGYNVVSVAGPSAALSSAESLDAAVDLVITDVVMPQMSGFLLAKELRSRHPGVQVLYMSGYTDQVLADRGELKDEDPFIRKPFSNDALLRKVREVLDTR
jgi:PAS domain S-box-containing protein